MDLAFKATISELCKSVRQNFNWWLVWSVGIDGREGKPRTIGPVVILFHLILQEVKPNLSW